MAVSAARQLCAVAFSFRTTETKMKRVTYGAMAFLNMALLSGAAQGQAGYKRNIPDSLAKAARISEDAAAATAQKRVPKGTIQAVELERENKRLIYSYELKVAGRSGVEEVNVDAITGKVVAAEHESPAAEKKERDKDKAKTPVKKP
jgi:uncharacterized membrane protein YkoI